MIEAHADQARRVLSRRWGICWVGSTARITIAVRHLAEDGAALQAAGERRALGDAVLRRCWPRDAGARWAADQSTLDLDRVPAVHGRHDRAVQRGRAHASQHVSRRPRCRPRRLVHAGARRARGGTSRRSPALRRCRCITSSRCTLCLLADPPGARSMTLILNPRRSSTSSSRCSKKLALPHAAGGEHAVSMRC